jgi:hypothetical protein
MDDSAVHQECIYALISLAHDRRQPHAGITAGVRSINICQTNCLTTAASGLSPYVVSCLIMILASAVVGPGGNGNDRAPRVAEAVVTHRSGDEPGNARMLLRADDQQRRG